MVVSLPMELSVSRANAPVGAAALGRQVTPSMLPSPAAVMLGMSSFGEVAQAPRVLTPTSPKDSASGIAPMPKESRTIKNTRFILSPYTSF